MNLYKSILIKLLDEEDFEFENICTVIQERCYKTLEEIVNIVRSPKI